MSKHQNDTTDRTTTLLMENIDSLKFCLIAILIFSLLYVVYSSLLIDIKYYNQYLNLLCSMASQLLNQFLSEATSVKYFRMSDTFELQFSNLYITINNSADAFIPTALLISAILAWPNSFIHKLMATIVCIAYMFTLNVFRIAATMLIEIYQPLYFDLFTIWILPIVLMLAALVFFYLWVLLSKSSTETPN